MSDETYDIRGTARVRAQSWSPASLTSGLEVAPGSNEADDSQVLFDACRFPRPQGDLLDCVIGEEPWERVETSEGHPVRVVGPAGALKRLFSLPLQAAGEALCIHRIGDCLVVLDSAAHDLDDSDDEDPSSMHGRSTAPAAATYSPRTTTTRYSPRTTAAARCQIRVDGEMVRIYPRIETAEPVDVKAPKAATVPTVACCEWRVREGITLLAVTPISSISSGDCGLADLRRSSQLRLMDVPSSFRVKGNLLADCIAGGDLVVAHEVAKSRPSLPEFHRRVTEDRTAVLVVPLSTPIESQMLVDAWLSCCLNGSPALLCFFVDSLGICKGCQFVPAADIPDLEKIADAYRSSALRSLGNESAGGEASAAAFDPRALREASHVLLESLIDRCDRDGDHFLVVPGPLGPKLLRAAFNDYVDDGASDDDVMLNPAGGSLALGWRPESVDLLAGASAADLRPPSPSKEVPSSGAESGASGGDRARRAYVTQALLMYHAAVRLAKPHESTANSADRAEGGDRLKGVPTGSRWTAKSCRDPLRVRQMMFRAVRALRAASFGTLEANIEATRASPLSQRRFHLLLASAFEFLADSFLAEDTHGDADLDVSRNLTAARHLKESLRNLAEYAHSFPASHADGIFARSVRQLEERLLAKAVNVRLCLARLRQRQPWRSGCDPSFRAIGQALRELDAAEEIVAKPARLTQPERAAGAYECSLLASICKWKAELLHDLAVLTLPCAVPGCELESQLREYLEAMQLETNESLQPLPMQCERWLQSTVSLSLRGLHQLASVPPEVATELLLQAKALLARAYGDLGHLYASTGRFTKAMTHAKQGIELFGATKDKLQAAQLQLWLCRLQLRMAVPQAAPLGRTAFVNILEDPALLCGLSAASPSEDSTCAQVVLTLQKALSALESDDNMEQGVFMKGQVLLGRVFLRQGLVRLARSKKPAFFAASRLCKEDGAIASALELLQVVATLSEAPPPEIGAEGSGPEEAPKDAVERLLQ
ncbi:unnamed protein product, partial [Polarella glacialis]